MGEKKQLATFLDLPTELRNTIYSLALLQQTPIELAPALSSDYAWGDDYCCLHPEARRRYFNGETWHRERYMKDIQPSLALLRACKQVNHEASPIYYGQEFRFTGALGWHILYDWLMLIGRKNNRMVTDIIVCHPAITKEVDGEVYDMGVTYARHDIKVSPVKTTFPRINTRNWRKERQQLRKWVKRSDPTLTLTSMTKLRNLKLVLLPRGNDANNIDFPACQSHPISGIKFSRSPDLQTSHLNLVRHQEAVLTGTHSINELRIETAYAHNPCPWLRANIHERGEEHQEEARKFFDWVTQKGWRLEEVLYDNHYTYPVPEMGKCNNEEVCKFLFGTGLYEEGEYSLWHYPPRECDCLFLCALIDREEEKLKCSDDDCEYCGPKMLGEDDVDICEGDSQG